MAFLDENGVAQLWAAIKSHVTTVSDTLFSDIGELLDTKFDKNKVVANYTTQGTGYALDASLGPAIKAKMDLADTLDTALSTWKSWTPMIYDQNTQIRSWNDGRYIEIGNLVFAYAFENNPSLANISTELQIRNVPMTAVIGGAIFIEKLSGSGGSITVQGGSSEKIYFRPAITSSQLSTPLTPGSVTFWCVGYK